MTVVSTIPLDPTITRARQRFNFTTTIRSRAYKFAFYHNGSEDFWVMTITLADGSALHRSKVVLGSLYAFPGEGWGFYFRDFGGTETTVNKQNLGDPVKGVLVELA